MFKTKNLIIVISITLLNCLSLATGVYAAPLNPIAIEFVERASTGSVTPDEVTRLTPEIINSLRPEHLLKLNPVVFSYFTKDQLSALSENAMLGFTAEVVAHLNPSAVSGFRANQLVFLSIEAMSGWNGETFAALQPEAVRGFNVEQMLGLKPSVLKSITPAQWNTSATILESPEQPIKVVKPSTMAKLDEMEKVLVSTNQKGVLEPQDIENLNKLSEELPAAAQTVNQAFQNATQAALEQASIEPLNNFESQIEPLEEKATTVAMLAQNTIEQLQAGETFLSPELVNNMTDEELASVLCEQGLKAHTETGIIPETRAQAINKLGIPALKPDIFNFSSPSCSSNSTMSPTSYYLDSVLDIFFPKAEAAVILGCQRIYCNLIFCNPILKHYYKDCVRRGKKRCWDKYQRELDSCSWWQFWCKPIAFAKYIACIG